MAPGRPELVFVAGCQAGQRSVLMSNITVAGRSQTADVQLREEYVSREQFRLTYTTDGWIVENLSATPIRINGKKYKRGLRVIVETGDVVGVGMKTEILFVAQGDDAEEAYAAYRTDHALGPAAQAPPPVEEKDQQGQIPPDAGEVGEEPEEEETEEEPEADQGEMDADEEAIQRKAKVKKYGIMFGVYMGLLIAGGIVMSFVFGDKTEEASSIRDLNQRDIEHALTTEPKRKGRDPRAAAEALKDAKAMLQDATVRDGNLYKSIKYFRLHLTYKRGPFDRVEDERLYQEAVDKLVELVQKKYRSALIFERNKQWGQAMLLFEEMLRIVPAKSEPEPEARNLLFDNVKDHLVFVRQKIREANAKPASPF